ncbi:Neurotrypsin-like [Oopsacas minuta]|uniref:Neurotrypsin-like n=1 Tax=Oopsacas minuta TaxID=111878 RepID=A0AAV7K1V2_9METZ|nr:Neurotrypsin-like [Oopsacas minuta]
MLLHISLLKELALLSILSLSLSQRDNDIRLFLPPSANLTRYQQSIINFLSASQSFQLGVLQIYQNTEWGSVCNDKWDSLDEKVVCSQLNLTYNIPYSSLSFLETLGQESLIDTPIWLDEVRCEGDERLLIDCPSLPVGIHDCTHAEDVNLMCSRINLVGIFEGIIAAIIILIIILLFCCLCCVCCCCPCCPIARQLRPNSTSKHRDTKEKAEVLRNKQSYILDYLPSPVQESNELPVPGTIQD